MPNPFEQNIKSLSDVYGSWNPMGYLRGMGQLDRADVYNENQLQQEQQKTTLEDLLRPSRVQQSQANADLTSAQVPGVRANSSLLSDKAALSNMTFGDQLDELVKGHQFKNREAELKQLEGAGRAYSQVGAYLGTIPGPARIAAAKQMLGGYWQPEFEQMDPNDLADTLTTAGKWMGEAGQKFQLQQAGLEKKTQSAEEIARINKESRIAAANAAKKTPAETMSQYEARIRAAAENDPNAAAELAKLQEQKIRERIAAAQVPDELKRQLLDLPSPSQPTTTVPTTPKSQKYEAGKEYTGKTGTYIWNGQEPQNNPKNWKKVR